jgi:hypothetical protein
VVWPTTTTSTGHPPPGLHRDHVQGGYDEFGREITDDALMRTRMRDHLLAGAIGAGSRWMWIGLPLSLASTHTHTHAPLTKAVAVA